MLLSEKASLRARLIYGILVLVLPFIILMGLSFYALRSTLSTIEELAFNPVEKLQFATNMQKFFQRSDDPVHGYVERGQKSDLATFNHLMVEVTLAFDVAYADLQFADRQLTLLTTVEHEWLNMVAIAEQIFEKEKHVGPLQDSVLYFEYKKGLDRSQSMLQQLENSIIANVHEQRLATQKLQWQSIVVAVIIICLAILFVVLGGFYLYRSIMNPIRRLEQSINRFGQGDLNSRASVKSNDELGHLALAFNGMAERFQKVQTELDYLSVHDSLTGLYDRAKFHALVNLEMLRAKRYDRKFSFLFIDIDDFRSVNECYGKLVGDSVLCSVAMQISSVIRPTDSAARFVDDEFAVILSETDEGGARESAIRIGRSIADNPINIGDGKVLNISVSIGVVTYPVDADSDSGLFALADLGLEKAKKSKDGKRAFSIHQGPVR